MRLRGSVTHPGDDLSPAVILVGLIGLGFACNLVFALLAALLATWPVMIALGVIHHYVSVVPPFGWLSLLVMLIALDLVVWGLQSALRLSGASGKT